MKYIPKVSLLHKARGPASVTKTGDTKALSLLLLGALGFVGAIFAGWMYVSDDMRSTLNTQVIGLLGFEKSADIFLIQGADTGAIVGGGGDNIDREEEGIKEGEKEGDPELGGKEGSEEVPDEKEVEFCGQYHTKTLYESTEMYENMSGLCAVGVAIPGSLVFSVTSGWTRSCAGGTLTSPDASNSVDCYAQMSYCGDGKIDALYGEECDDARDNADYASCSRECLASRCGNGVIESGEVCDDGNTNDIDDCSNSCQGKGANICFTEEISLEGKTLLVNGTMNIKWSYTIGGTVHEQFIIEDTIGVNTCDRLKEEMAKAYCGDMYDSIYFDASGLLHAPQSCTTASDGTIRMTTQPGAIRCCNTLVCNDDADNLSPDPDIQSCFYNYPGDTSTGPGCTDGVKVCRDNEYGSCLPLAKHLGVEEELCDGLDEDCDGEVDEGLDCSGPKPEEPEPEEPEPEEPEPEEPEPEEPEPEESEPEESEPEEPEPEEPEPEEPEPEEPEPEEPEPEEPEPEEPEPEEPEPEEPKPEEPDDEHYTPPLGPRTGGNNYCGDGKISLGEMCDDGNVDDGDGCNSSCDIEVENDIDDEGDQYSETKDVFADHLADALETLEQACDYDDYNYQDIMFRDVTWDPDNEAINTLLAYCIVKGYNRTRNKEFHVNAATSKAEAIKVLTKLDAMGYSIPFDEKAYVHDELPYKDMKPNAWYTTYVIYAYTQGLLDGIGQEKLLGSSELKALTPIKKSEMRTLLENAGIYKEYHELEGYGQYVYRDDMARIMVDAFEDQLQDYQYLYGNNIKLYTMLLRRLQYMDPDEQISYIKQLLRKLRKMDHWFMGENFNLHVRGIILFLENVVVQVE